MVRHAAFPAQKVVTFSRELLQGCVVMTENGLGPMTLFAEVKERE